MFIVHAASNLLFLASASKCVHVVNTKGENINICWSPNGNTIAVGNKVCKARECIIESSWLRLKRTLTQNLFRKLFAFRKIL